MNNISVIIPTYNSYDTLEEAIISLRLQSLRPLEIIVVDNASADNTSEKTKKKFPSVKVITTKKNLGVTGGRNEGLKHISRKATAVMFFDHDMVADKKMIEELNNVLLRNKKIGIVTPKIFYWDKKDIIWSAGTDVNLTSGQTLFRGGKDTGQYEKTEEVSVAPAVLLVRKELVDKGLRFDDIYFATYEDTDFCFRAKTMGYKTYYTPLACAYHKIPYDNSKANLRLLDRTYYVARNRIIFMKRFSDKFSLFVCFIPIYFLYYAFLSIRYYRIKPIYFYVKGVIDGFLTI